ncbi:MAG: bifunctional N-acetyltransferase/class I SAM-dependent methyltransferase [Bacteroides sp.]|nr:bifunctional N-acetyltransferase/class I SAM-dependent methyltransferase [Roseburia sp.]MCM1346666.1 bifunctional N-acetyltransferase/class I SAM-dependent methyltransferase [Bacteroides sp.]MCM1421623.1 bifunctional N-acetyltransferase/class I SAM-dependent methyltransferase [Bacteroides sp.]
MEYRFISKPCSVLTDEEYSQCADLFSLHYGKYSGEGDKPKGQQIKMGRTLYKRFYAGRNDMFVSLCYGDDVLLGQVFFLRKEIQGKGLCTWITQLVVHNRYRNRKIGTKLLQSAWGFSDYYAWGLATANAITLKTLESVTWRKIDIDYISKNIDVLEQLIDDIPFVERENLRLTKKKSQIFSNFYPELESSNDDKTLCVYARRLGKIESGNEWLAFTFVNQEMLFSEENFKRFLEFSDQQLKDAYSRMDMPVQPWTKGTKNEVDFISGLVGLKRDMSVLDLGCGQGRHALELASRGVDNVVGFDFSDIHIEKARESALARGLKASFICGDVRTLRLGNKYDLILCLYDVIGSFRDEADNKKILRVIKHHLRHGGRAIVSVMNMELTEANAIHKVSLKENPRELLRLPPSDTMAVSGNIFKPEFYLINTDDGLVYRKEQFERDGMLSTEYVVVDKRYKAAEFKAMAAEVGLKVECQRYVQAGKWDVALNATDSRAKEILFVLSL